MRLCENKMKDICLPLTYLPSHKKLATLRGCNLYPDRSDYDKRNKIFNYILPMSHR